MADGDEITLTYTLSDGSSGLRARMSYTGEYEFTLLNGDASAWTLLNAYPGPGCSRYDSCGSYGYCDGTEMEAIRRTCRCPEGFEPKAKGSGGPWAGCTRKETLRCDAAAADDQFATLTGVKTPATPVFVRNRTLGGCEAECRGNCSCTAYAYTNLRTAISGGHMSRCLLWFGELVDIAKDVNIDGENLYLRLAGSSTGTYLKQLA